MIVKQTVSMILVAKDVICQRRHYQLWSLPALVGNNRSYIGGWMLVNYYLPGNRSAHPPEHLVHGSTLHTEGEQTHFDPSRMEGAREVDQ